MYPLTTAARRSTVVHAVDDSSASFTFCGRRIGDDWQGEYDLAPEGPVTCRRCLASTMADGRTVEQSQNNEPGPDTVVKFTVGTRVGILTGFQSVGGAWIGSYGEVTAVREYWNGQASYLVRADGEIESYVYEGWMLTDDTSRDVAPIREAAAEAGIPTGDDGWPVVGHPVWEWNASHSGDLLVSIAEWSAREACKDRHPAGKGLPPFTLAAFPITDRMMHAMGGFDAFTRRGWTVRRAEMTSNPRVWVVMAARVVSARVGADDYQDAYEYVVATITPGAHEWNAGTYTRNMETADFYFRNRSY